MMGSTNFYMEKSYSMLSDLDNGKCINLFVLFLNRKRDFALS